MKIAILDDYSDAFRRTSTFERLAAHEVVVFTDTERDPARLAARLQGCEAVVLTQQRSALPRAVIERLPELRLVSQTGHRATHVDVDACTERGIVVSAGGGGLSYATAELTWGLIIAAARHLPFEIERLKQGHWQSTIGIGLRGRRLGVYGFGKIGALVATVARAFGMNVVVLGREGSLERARAAGFEAAASREAFFAQSDVVTLHLVLNDATRGIVTAADLARMKPSAILVNTSRGPLIAKDALAAALRAGRPGFAAIDVFDDEPVLGASDPLIGLPNAICTPHLGYVIEEGLESFYSVAIEQLVAFAAGKPINVLNPAAVGKVGG
jgi:D-3-phosphoglycerate dehydrogenase / 2-oxoglutarate reductase